MPQIQISYYSDVLCIWAYIAERRLEQLARDFGDQISIETHFCSVFPDAWGKIENKWDSRGGFEGFNRHLRDVAKKFPHVDVRDDLWLTTRPRTSASAYLFVKAVELIELADQDQGTKPLPYLDRMSTRAAWEVRLAFFAQAKDISDWHVLREIAERMGIDSRAVEEKIRSSEAIARLAADYDLSQKNGIAGSPTFVMNDGRQKLFGNVGYRLLEANVQELLRCTPENEASWC
jgi:predicted DsbA family dithiol-disulfide isomerase